jgi:hypothetical protein
MITSRRSSGMAAGVTVTALLALAPALATAASPTCDTLRGRDLVSGAAVKVVDRTSRTSRGTVRHSYLACTLPSGRVRALKASRKGGRLELLDHTGAFLTVRDVGSRRADVVNVLRGTRRRVSPLGVNPVGRVLVGQAGEVAALAKVNATTSLIGFDYDGTSYAIDRGSIPAASLRRKGSNVTWTQAGTARTTDLSTPKIPCAKLGGQVLLTTDTLRVVDLSFDDEYLVGEIDGRTTRTRACLLAGGPVRVLGNTRFATDGIQGGESFDVFAGAGTYVLERTMSSDSQGDFTPDTVASYNLATDQRVSLWGNSFAEGPNEALGSPYPKFVLSASGQVGAVFQDTSGDGETVIGFTADGRATTLDTAPAADIDEKSLGITGTVIHWKHSGAERTSDLAAL